MEAKPFEPLHLNWDKYNEVENYVETSLLPEQRWRLNNLFELIAGFESTLALEELATIHYVLNKYPDISESDLYDKVKSWNGRKESIVKEEHISIALEHLSEFRSKLHFA